MNIPSVATHASLASRQPQVKNQMRFSGDWKISPLDLGDIVGRMKPGGTPSSALIAKIKFCLMGCDDSSSGPSTAAATELAAFLQQGVNDNKVSATRNRTDVQFEPDSTHTLIRSSGSGDILVRTKAN